MSYFLFYLLLPKILRLAYIGEENQSRLPTVPSLSDEAANGRWTSSELAGIGEGMWGVVN